MEKEEIIKILKTNHYPFTEKENLIDVKIANGYYLSICMKDNRLSTYKDYIKNWFGKRISLRSTLYSECVGFIVLLLFAIGFNWMNEVSLFTLNVFYITLIVYLIGASIRYSFLSSKLKKIGF